ncbi:MAG: hypothetical protein ACK5JR_19845 [Tropicimonas sp.]|uniref:hypothetical protein n=1 Tax=Tropicimonas sp. TaxID=2067044 RepID=UPI003A856251
MAGEEEATDAGRAANDNRPPGEDEAIPDTFRQLDAVVLTIARLIGRSMAREGFEALQGENDNNKPSEAGDDGDQ